MAHYDIDYKCLMCSRYMFSAMPDKKVHREELFCTPEHRKKYYSKAETVKREKREALAQKAHDARMQKFRSRYVQPFKIKKVKVVNEQDLVQLQRRVQIVTGVIEMVDHRCMAVDGPVSKTREEITDEEMRRIYRAGKAALRYLQKMQQ